MQADAPRTRLAAPKPSIPKLPKRVITSKLNIPKPQKSARGSRPGAANVRPADPAAANDRLADSAATNDRLADSETTKPDAAMSQQEVVVSCFVEKEKAKPARASVEAQPAAQEQKESSAGEQEFISAKGTSTAQVKLTSSIRKPRKKKSIRDTA